MSTDVRTPKHRARPTLVTGVREFRAAQELAEWSRRGVEHPTYRGRRAADTTGTVSYHPTHPGWGRLAAAILANEATPGDPEALSGIGDVDEDVAVELAHRTSRRPS